MIICDTFKHKVDAAVEVLKDGSSWLSITSFHRKSETEWATKVIRLSMESTEKLLKVIQDARAGIATTASEA